MEQCNCGSLVYCKNKCKKCYMKDYSKKYYLDNLSSEKARLKLYKVKNKEAEKTRNQQWQSENRDYVNSRQRNKYQTDIQVRLANTLRRRIGKSLRSGSHVQNLGCSIQELKKHLESKFQEGMTWENYGKWHIDHIKPLSKYNLENEDELKEVCHYSNLQPLWAKENISKGNN